VPTSRKLQTQPATDEERAKVLIGSTATVATFAERGCGDRLGDRSAAVDGNPSAARDRAQRLKPVDIWNSKERAHGTARLGLLSARLRSLSAWNSRAITPRSSLTLHVLVGPCSP